MKLNSTAEAKKTVFKIVQLDKRMKRLQDNPLAWRHTLGVPGARYMPEWERLMNLLTEFYAECEEYAANEIYDYELALRKEHGVEDM